jgi:hypothetical protein
MEIICYPKEVSGMTRKILIPVFLIAVLVAAPSIAQAEEFVTDGLIGFWTLDKKNVEGDTADDIFGKNAATIQGDPKLVEGKIEEALEFDGKDDYVQLPDMGDEELVTVEAWTLAHAMPPVAHACCTGIVSAAPADQWKAGTVHFKYEANQITVHKNDSVKLRFQNVELDTWYHVAYTCDTKKNELKLYANGELIGTGAAGNTPNNLTHIVIASEHEGRYLPGLVDEVRIYNRILSEDEIQKNFAITARAVEPGGKLSLTWGTIKASR